MSEKIRVLIVDDLVETRQNVSKLLQFEHDIEVVDQASNGQEAIDKTKKHKPDIVLMDINMPGVDGIRASRSIIQAVPTAQIIIMSVQSEADYLRQAMLAGARDFLMKPFGAEQLTKAVRDVYRMRPTVVAPTIQLGMGSTAGSNTIGVSSDKLGNVISVFSPKGGTGCSTLAINLAVGLAQRGHSTILIDGRLQFGDVAVMLNLKATTTILDLIDRVNELEFDLVQSVALTHDSSGLKVLLAPPRPEMAELITSEHMEALLDEFKKMYNYVVVDTSSDLSPLVLSILDRSTRIVLVAHPGLPSIKSARYFYDLATELEYESFKTLLVINRVLPNVGIPAKNIGDALKQKVFATIPSDDATAISAANKGQPFILEQKRPISIALNQLTDKIVKDIQPVEALEEIETEPAKKQTSRFGRLFGR